MLANDLKLVTKDIAAEVFSVSVKTIDNYIKDGLLPPPKRFVSKEYWHLDDFREFLNLTFRTGWKAGEGEAGVAGGAVPVRTTHEAESSSPAKPAKKREQSKDSSPVVRHRGRQAELLRHLNA